MPIYEYGCKGCGEVCEYTQRMSDDPKTTCESCGGALERLISRTAFHLKGGGWYKDLYASKKPDAGDSGGAGAGDSKSSDSSSSKSSEASSSKSSDSSSSKSSESSSSKSSESSSSKNSGSGSSGSGSSGSGSATGG